MGKPLLAKGYLSLYLFGLANALFPSRFPPLEYHILCLGIYVYTTVFTSVDYSMLAYQ